MIPEKEDVMLDSVISLIHSNLDCLTILDSSSKFGDVMRRLAHKTFKIDQRFGWPGFESFQN